MKKVDSRTKGMAPNRVQSSQLVIETVQQVIKVIESKVGHSDTHR